MTIVSKDAADSTSGPSTSLDSKSNYLATDEPISGPPPSYEDVQAGPSGSGSSSTASLPRPTNFMSVNKNYGGIKDVWVIDTDIRVPEALLPSLGFLSSLRTITRPNLSLYSAYGAVDFSAFLISASSKKAFIKAHTQSGSVTCKVSRLGSKQPFRLEATTSYGSVVFGIPRDYVGPLRYKTDYGSIKISPALKPHLLEISGENGFVGSVEESGFVDLKSWRGDEAELKTNYGSISLMYLDELEALGPGFQVKLEGVVSNVLKWFGLGQ